MIRLLLTDLRYDGVRDEFAEIALAEYCEKHDIHVLTAVTEVGDPPSDGKKIVWAR